MGNIKFGEDDNEYSFIKEKTGPLGTVAVSVSLYLITTVSGHYQELMGIELNLLEVILTISESIVRGDRVRRHLNKEKAEGTSFCVN